MESLTPGNIPQGAHIKKQPKWINFILSILGGFAAAAMVGVGIFIGYYDGK